MLKRPRVFFATAVFFLVLLSLPPDLAVSLKTGVYSALKFPARLSQQASDLLGDFFYFRRNARELAALRQAIGKIREDAVQTEELRLENERLRRLLGLRRTVPAHAREICFARVVAKSLWGQNRTLLIDRGTRDGVRPPMFVLSESSLVGKVVEAGPHLAKVLLINDVGSRIGVLVQRTRQMGVLTGTLSAECRVKYLPVESSLREGDIVETSGVAGFFPKGIVVGRVKKIWKEPGQMYQTAEITPYADFSRVEEVACVAGPTPAEEEAG
ncbi:MAG: rod shape-determining protein MreC [Candidatus Omnitrophica bacterium]|nr:rod shape-determining protein MreC [Candidatus Omnitrophota bacterium]